MKKNSVLLAFLVMMCGQAFTQNDQQVAYHFNQWYDYENDTIAPKQYHVDSLLHFAGKYLGVPYVSPGRDPSGFDCSGFTFYCFKTYGVYLPYTAHEQAEIGHEVHLLEARAGDLAFFQGYDKNDHKVHHVAIVTSKPGEKLQFIHAASHGVHRDNIDSPYYHPRLIEIRRIR
ncbi:MAG: C40 family peptidase [Cytophagaceae bacterium]